MVWNVQGGLPARVPIEEERENEIEAGDLALAWESCILTRENLALDSIQSIFPNTLNIKTDWFLLKPRIASR